MFAVAARPRSLAGRGFTLIELLVVMSIMAILIALLVPILTAAKRQVSITRTRAAIDGISMALETYKQVHNTYPPDRNPLLAVGGNPAGKCLSSECLVYYLSGASICYVPGTTPANYPWRHLVYNNSTGGVGREAYTIYYPFNASLLRDGDGDLAPEVYDPWQHRIIYNTGGTQNYATPPSGTLDPCNQYGAPKHNLKKFDLVSAGPDGIFGPDSSGNNDDVTNYKDALPDDYGDFNLGKTWGAERQ